MHLTYHACGTALFFELFYPSPASFNSRLTTTCEKIKISLAGMANEATAFWMALCRNATDSPILRS